MWWVIGGAILVIVMVIFILIWFQGGGTKAFNSISEQLGGLEDCDGDTAADRFDDCPCNRAIQELTADQTSTDCGACTIDACN